MKAKIITTAALIFCLTGFSQLEEIPTWNLTGLSIYVGGTGDNHSQMSTDWIFDHTNNPQEILMDVEGEEEVYTRVAGLTINGFASIERPTANPKVSDEVRIGARLITDREAVVSFSEEIENSNFIRTEQLILCLMDSEVDVYASFIRKKHLKRGSIFAGLTGEIGTTFNPQTLRIRSWFATPVNPEEVAPIRLTQGDSSTEFYEAKSSVFGRAVIPFGAQWNVLERCSIGAQYHFGVGFEKMIGGQTYFLTGTNSFQVGLSYLL